MTPRRVLKKNLPNINWNLTRSCFGFNHFKRTNVTPDRWSRIDNTRIKSKFPNSLQFGIRQMQNSSHKNVRTTHTPNISRPNMVLRNITLCNHTLAILFNPITNLNSNFYRSSTLKNKKTMRLPEHWGCKKHHHPIRNTTKTGRQDITNGL